MREGIHDLTIQSLVVQVFEQKTVKGKGDEKSIGKQESKIDHPKFIFASAVLGQLDTVRRTYRQNILQNHEKTDFLKDAWN